MTIFDLITKNPITCIIIAGIILFTVLVFITAIFSFAKKIIRPKYNYETWYKELEESFGTYQKCIKFIEETKKNENKNNLHNID